jgi:hypothetical protein
MEIITHALSIFEAILIIATGVSLGSCFNIVFLRLAKNSEKQDVTSTRYWKIVYQSDDFTTCVCVAESENPRDAIRYFRECFKKNTILNIEQFKLL